MSQSENAIKELRKLLSNFEKGVGRQYTEKTINEKQDKLTEYLEIIEKETEGKDSQDLKNLRADAVDIGEQIQEFIDKQTQLPKMPFDIKVATSLVTPYNGKEEDTE